MKEINIAKAIISKRREKGITQEELANHIGVSSASVSKWETEQSYPDILLLPQLAAYFNISIDELMGYRPQMSKKDIDKLYCKLYNDLSNKPFDEVIGECREKIKKYFSCFPLLLQIGSLLMAASALAPDKEKSSALVLEAKELFVRVKTESDNAELMKAALCSEACCSAMLGNHNEVIELLEKSSATILPHESLLAPAYQATGRQKEAETVLQEGIYQYILSALGLLSSYAMLGAEDVNKLDEIVKRTSAIIEAFNIKKIQPAIIINFYAAAAQGYLSHQNTDKLLDLLEQYTDLVSGDISLQFKGDDFFSFIDDKLSEDCMVDAIFPNENVKQGYADVVINNPMFSALGDNPRFQVIAKRLGGICK